MSLKLSVSLVDFEVIVRHVFLASKKQLCPFVRLPLCLFVRLSINVEFELSQAEAGRGRQITGH